MPSSPYLVSQIITATMLFLQFMLYSSSFVGTLKNEIPEAALELCQLKIKQLSPKILKFRTVVPRSFLFVFHARLCGLGSNNYRNSSYKEKTASSARVSRLSFHFLWLCWQKTMFQQMVSILKRKLLNVMFHKTAPWDQYYFYII